MHQFIDVLQLTQTNGLVWNGNQTSSVEINGLSRVSAVTNIATLDVDHAKNSVENWGADASIGRKTNANDSATSTDILGCLLEGLLLNSDEKTSMGAQTIRRRGLDLSNQIRRAHEVNKGSSTELETEIALLRAAVDSDGVETHRLGVLECTTTEATACADNGNRLAGLGARLLEALVDGDTSA